MITDFFVECKNGFKLTPGKDPIGVSDMDLFLPEYQPAYYVWTNEGTQYKKKHDAIDARSVQLTPTSKNLIVTQSSKKYGSNNLLILNSDGTESHRLVNPYKFSPEYENGDEFEFLPPQVTKEKLVVKISVYRTLPGKSYSLEPTYGTFYNCETWEHTPLELLDSRNV